MKAVAHHARTLWQTARANRQEIVEIAEDVLGAVSLFGLIIMLSFLGELFR